MFDGEDLDDNKGNWQQVKDLTVRGIAKLICRELGHFEEMSKKLPDLSALKSAVIDKIVDCIKDGEWSKELEI